MKSLCALVKFRDSLLPPSSPLPCALTPCSDTASSLNTDWPQWCQVLVGAAQADPHGEGLSLREGRERRDEAPGP